MPEVIFTDEDIKSVNELPADWYVVRIKAIEEGNAKSDGSTKWVLTAIVSSGPQAGTPVRCTFSEKFMGPFVKFMKAFGKVEKGVKLNYEAVVGKEVEAFCAYDSDWGNQPKEWRPLRSK